MNHVFQDFTLHTIDGHISTIYLAVYSDKILILDCGCRCDITRVETYIEKRLKKDLSTVKLVVASHAHPDHGGGSPFSVKNTVFPLRLPVTSMNGTVAFWDLSNITSILHWVIMWREPQASPCQIYSTNEKLPLIIRWTMVLFYPASKTGWFTMRLVTHTTTWFFTIKRKNSSTLLTSSSVSTENIFSLFRYPWNIR